MASYIDCEKDLSIKDLEQLLVDYFAREKDLSIKDIEQLVGDTKKELAKRNKSE